MSDLINYYENPRNKSEERQADSALESIQCNSYIGEGSVFTWLSNDRVPANDILELAAHIGIEFNMENSVAKREADQAAFLAEYIEGQANRSEEQLAEERFEMRAAFGEGETVVNIFTGEKTYL